jgi:hypothetical protein
VPAVPPGAFPTPGPTRSASAQSGAAGSDTARASVVIVSTNSPVNSHDNVSVTAQATPGSQCTLEYTNPQGATARIGAVGREVDETGRITWDWSPAGFGPGTGTVSVSCNMKNGGATASASASVSIQVN